MPKKDSSKSKISRKSSEHGKEHGTKGSSAKIGRKMSADASDASDDSGENTRRADKLKRNKTLDGRAEATSVAYQDILDTVAKVVRINSVALSEESRMHSGLLGLDLILGRGIGPTWCTFAGPEQSAKTTLAITVMAATINQKVPISVLWDAEQSSGSSADYVANVLAGQNVHNDISEVFGVRKHGKWVTRPLVYYQDETNGEVFFNWLHALGKRLPDKRFENERWWYIYENTKDNIAKYGSKADKTLSKANHGLWLPAEDDSLQAVIILDSYPSLMPTAQDNDEHTKAMAVQARMFSLHLPRVKGFVRSKRIAILGINQIRMNPGAMFGSPEVEPCGAALKFFCFSEDTLLVTEKGLFTAEEFDRAPSKSNLLGQAGFERPTHYGEQGYSQQLTLHTSKGHRMTGKPGHNVLTVNPHTLETSFRSLQDLRDNRQKPCAVAIRLGGAPDENFSARLEFGSTVSQKYCPSRLDNPVTLPTEVAPKLAWLIGALVGDGHVRNGMVVLTSTTPEVTQRAGRFITEIFGIEPCETRSETRAYSLAVSEFLTYLGAGSKSSWQKEIPWAIRHSGRSVWLAFLAGLFDTDFGTNKATLSYCSASARLIDQVRVMSLALGFPISSGNTRDTWWAHGENSRKEFSGGTLTAREVSKKHITKYPELRWYGESAREFIDEIEPYVANKHRFAKYRGGYRDSHTATWRMLPPTPQFEKLTGGNDIRKALWLYTEITKRNPATMDCWDASWIPGAREYAAALVTSQEREKAARGLDKLEEFITFSRDNRIFWDAPSGITADTERKMTYDGTMPETHTIVTNGIVSHNSDQRVKLTPRALSAVPFNPKGEGQYETEPSIDGGVDKYRYVRGVAFKNKLGTPNQDMWFRLWVEDSNGEGRGYDLVWDTFYTMFLCGLITGKRHAMKLNVPGLGEGKRSLNWLQFKTLILGSKEQRADICKTLGWRTVDLRKGLINLTKKGVLDDLYWQGKKEALVRKKSSMEVASTDDDDDEDED